MGATDGGAMDSCQQEIVSLALDKMLNRSAHFSICDVDRLAKTLGANCDAHPDYRYLSALHCVRYSDMSNELKDKLPLLIMSVLSSRFDTHLMARALAAVQSGEIKDLPCTEDDRPTRRLVLTRG